MCPPSVQVCLSLVQTLKYTLQNRFVREKANLRLRVFADIAWDQAPQRGKEGKKRGEIGKICATSNKMQSRLRSTPTNIFI